MKMIKRDKFTFQKLDMKKNNNKYNFSNTKITQELLYQFDDQTTAQLAKRLEGEDYPNPFESLNDWHLLRALAIHRPELTLDYHHLIDQEPFDED